MSLHGMLVRRQDLTREQRESMFALMDRHYERMRRDTFLADLEEKEWAILLREGSSEQLCGFSTVMLLDVTAHSRPIKAVFSGDTIVAQEHWGERALAKVFGRLMLDLIESNPDIDLYWFLICKGYKTYRFLPLFFHEFYPRHDAPTPSWASGLIDALGRAKFPDAYDAAQGLVRCPEKDRLRPGIADVTEERLRDPHIQFFAQRNPRHALGEELCCVAPLTAANLTPAAYRVIGARPVEIGAT